MLLKIYGQLEPNRLENLFYGLRKFHFLVHRDLSKSTGRGKIFLIRNANTVLFNSYTINALESKCSLLCNFDSNEEKLPTNTFKLRNA